MRGLLLQTVAAGMIGALGALATAAGLGCQTSPPPPPRVEVPPEPGGGGPVRERVIVKPLPEPDEDESYGATPPPFDDVPLVAQQPPEQRAFIAAYERVGRPKIAVFVNRTLEGKILPVREERGVVGVERVRRTTGEVEIDNRSFRNRERFSAKGPAEVSDSVEIYLPPGQYDDALAQQIDYEAIELVLTDFLSADGEIDVISPTMTRQRLTDQQVKELQEGRPQMLGEIARELDTDILVQVTARPTRQSRRTDVGVRVLAEAINVRGGGQSVGRAFVDVPPPLTKTRINKFSRFVARTLMDRMIGTWDGYEPPEGFEPGTEMPEQRRPAARTAPPLPEDPADRRGLLPEETDPPPATDLEPETPERRDLPGRPVLPEGDEPTVDDPADEPTAE